MVLSIPENRAGRRSFYWPKRFFSVRRNFLKKDLDGGTVDLCFSSPADKNRFS